MLKLAKKTTKRRASIIHSSELHLIQNMSEEEALTNVSLNILIYLTPSLVATYCCVIFREKLLQKRKKVKSILLKLKNSSQINKFKQ
jgi:hypothetical protein